MGRNLQRLVQLLITGDRGPLAPEGIPWGSLINRGLSVLVALAYIVVALASGAGPEVLRFGVYLMIAVLLIWYSDEIGDLMIHWNVQITAPSPGWMVRVLAWMLLLMPAFVALMYAVYQ